MTAKRDVVLLVATLFVAALGVAAVVLYPYYRMPPESTAVLDAKLAEYERIVHEMENRPREGRQALDKLSRELEPIFKPHNYKTMFGWKCPYYDAAKLKTHEATIRQIVEVSAPLEKVLTGGLVIQQGANPEDGVVDYEVLREVVAWQGIAAVLGWQQGRAADFHRHLDLIFGLVEALYEVPHLFYLMAAIALEYQIDNVVIHLLPSLPVEDLSRVADKLAALPDPRAAYGRASRVSIVEGVRRIDDFREGRIAEYNMPFYGRLLATLARHSGYLCRERYVFVGLVNRDIEAYDAWLAAGGHGRYQDPEPAPYQICPLAFWSWIGLAPLEVFCSNAYSRRQAVLAAMAEELVVRQTGHPAVYTVDYDPETGSRITVNRSFGCYTTPAEPAEDQPEP